MIQFSGGSGREEGQHDNAHCFLGVIEAVAQPHVGSAEQLQFSKN